MDDELETAGSFSTLRLKNLMLKIFLGALAACAFAAIIWIVTGNTDDFGLRIFGTSATVALFTILSLSGAALFDRKLMPALGATSVGSGLASMSLLIIAIWNGGFETGLWRLTGVVSVVAFAAAQLSILRLITGFNRPNTFRAFIATAIVTTLLALIAIVLIVATPSELSDSFWRMVGVLVVLDVFGFCAIPIVRLLESKN
jgi:hypothetical protein